MSLIFRAMEGTLTETVAHGGDIDVKPTGARIEDDQVIKLRYVQFVFNLTQLYPSSTSNSFVSARLEYMPGGWEIRHDIILGGSFEGSKDFFIPDSFPEFVSEEFVITLETGNIEALQQMDYRIIYEVLSADSLKIAQALENYSMY